MWNDRVDTLTFLLIYDKMVENYVNIKSTDG